ncbi:hypothetical protein EB093_03670 [bacterium]|nr:hypothetical protein [bacterium]
MGDRGSVITTRGWIGSLPGEVRIKNGTNSESLVHEWAKLTIYIAKDFAYYDLCFPNDNQRLLHI